LKVLIIDDNEFIRQGVQQILSEAFPLVEVGAADTGRRGIAAAHQEPWDLAIVEISLPDLSGLDLLRELHSTVPRLPLMVLSLHPEKQYALRAFRAGAMAYLNKRATPAELAKAAKQVLTGKMYVSSSLAVYMTNRMRENSVDPDHHALSDREFEILVLIAHGQSVKDIARFMTLSIETVNSYRASLLDKLRLTTTNELIRYALHHQLIDSQGATEVLQRPVSAPVKRIV
jgi:two-component system, NarL family, invasion response regulator UvrY